MYIRGRYLPVWRVLYCGGVLGKRKMPLLEVVPKVYLTLCSEINWDVIVPSHNVFRG